MAGIGSMALLLTLAAGEAPTEVRAAVARVKQEVVDAYVRCDAAALERLYADDYTVADADGAVRTKADELAQVRAGKCNLLGGRYEPVAMRVFGDIAVMSGHATLVLRGEGGPRELRYYSHNVFRREAGAWRYVAAFTP